MKSARQIAFEVLIKMHRNDAYSNIELDSALKNSGLDKRDCALVSALVYGVTERIITIDYNIQKHLTGKINKLKPEVLVILRLGAYQILFSEKIPNSAAVNESVKLAKNNRCAFASGLCNAVLRAIGKSGLLLPEDKEKKEYLSVKYSFPRWLCELWQKAYGEENAEGIMQTAAEKPPIYVRVNNLRTTSDELIDIFKNEGVAAEPVKYFDSALQISDTGDIEKLSSYKNGCFHVQDLASQLCAKALEAEENMTVFDVCSAPGGKAFTVAEYMNNKGIIKAFDIHEHRVKLINSGAKRLGISIIEGKTGDAEKYDSSNGLADRVLCDVPCSGLGIVRRKPEIRYKEKILIDKLPLLQYRILENASKYVKPSGRLVYSTCTLNPAENEDVCQKFLLNHKEFKLVHPLKSHGFDDCGYITLMPHIHGTDGFFIAAFERLD